MKVDELRELEEDQLGDRMRAARRELYELRFKHAVGQLENSSQIAKVRHDIARIMTVISERELGLAPVPVHDTAPVAVAVKDEGFEAEPEVAEETVAPAPVEDAPKPKRVRKAKTEAQS
ncbi:MAG TPA: 50S ribosomal protein L29 [Chloroflexi bacterium]|nr:50S ribosomal protein L29 [Chloroflexota bacterium]HAF19196.1 50S ribosomal protein L29 [Chloroflexota bacterium]